MFKVNNKDTRTGKSLLGVDISFALNVSLRKSAQMQNFDSPYLRVVALNTEIYRVDLPRFQTLGEYFCVTISIILERLLMRPFNSWLLP